MWFFYNQYFSADIWECLQSIGTSWRNKGKCNGKSKRKSQALKKRGKRK